VPKVLMAVTAGTAGLVLTEEVVPMVLVAVKAMPGEMEET